MIYPISLTLGSLFDGISGFALAASFCGIETKWISEIDPYCLKISNQHFPYAKQYKDIRHIGKGRKYEPEPVNIISGGFPCQPFSLAGQRGGQEDPRYLWPEMLRIISEVRPAWVVGENVGGLVSMEQPESIIKMESEDIVCKEAEMVLETIRRDLAGIGYESQPIVIPACALDAPHRRDRVWIVAHSDSLGLQGRKKVNEGRTFGKEQLQRLLQDSFWATVSRPGIHRVAHGIPNRVDRLKALGNAIVPQVALEIFKAIIKVELFLQEQ